MKINKSNVSFSSIVSIGQKIKKISKETGQQFLELNRGVNSVVEIDLSEIIPMIDFNSKNIQVYAPNLGVESLRQSILKEYFESKPLNCIDNISITPGGVPSLDMVIQTLDIKTIYLPKFYWGAYSKIITIRNKEFKFYDSLDNIDITKLNESTAVIICDPSNPTGIKLDDHYLLTKIRDINNTGCITILDSPYRKLFYKDNFFDMVSDFSNVIITESFSKWIGLSGLRLGFIWSSNKEFNEELNIRILYEFNGVSTVSQNIVDKVISTEEGMRAYMQFQTVTKENIKSNIKFLDRNGLLPDDIYNGTVPIGIFAVINKTEDFLFKNNIGAVSLDKFVNSEKEKWSKYSRICVSVKNDIFESYMNKIVEKVVV